MKMNNKKNINFMEDLSLIFNGVIRIKAVIFWSLIFLLGFSLGLQNLSINKLFYPFIVIIVNSLLFSIFIFTINNYYDIETDKDNPRRKKINAIAQGEVNIAFVKILIIFCVITTLSISIFFKGYELFLLSLFCLISSWIYSAPPLRLKGKPVIDVFWHFLGFFLFVIYGSYIAGEIKEISLLVAFSAGIFSCIFQICNHILDYDYDKKSKTKTIAVLLGVKKTKKILNLSIIINFLILVILIILFSINHYIPLIIIIIGLIFSLYLSMSFKKKTVKKFSVVNFSFFISIFVYISCSVYNILLLIN